MSDEWSVEGKFIVLNKGSIEKLIGRKLTWEDNAVEIKGSNKNDS